MGRTQVHFAAAAGARKRVLPLRLEALMSCNKLMVASVHRDELESYARHLEAS